MKKLLFVPAKVATPTHVISDYESEYEDEQEQDQDWSAGEDEDHFEASQEEEEVEVAPPPPKKAAPAKRVKKAANPRSLQPSTSVSVIEESNDKKKPVNRRGPNKKGPTTATRATPVVHGKRKATGTMVEEEVVEYTTQETDVPEVDLGSQCKKSLLRNKYKLSADWSIQVATLNRRVVNRSVKDYLYDALVFTRASRDPTKKAWTTNFPIELIPILINALRQITGTD